MVLLLKEPCKKEIKESVLTRHEVLLQQSSLPSKFILNANNSNSANSIFKTSTQLKKIALAIISY